VFCENESPDHNDTATLAADGTLHACRSTGAGDAHACHTFGPYRCEIPFRPSAVPRDRCAGASDRRSNVSVKGHPAA
jgi:hypothetical protein